MHALRPEERAYVNRLRDLQQSEWIKASLEFDSIAADIEHIDEEGNIFYEFMPAKEETYQQRNIFELEYNIHNPVEDSFLEDRLFTADEWDEFSGNPNISERVDPHLEDPSQPNAELVSELDEEERIIHIEV